MRLVKSSTDEGVVETSWYQVRELIGILYNCQIRIEAGRPLNRKTLLMLRKIAVLLQDHWEDEREASTTEAFARVVEPMAEAYRKYKAGKLTMKEMKVTINRLFYVPDDHSYADDLVARKSYIKLWKGSKAAAARKAAKAAGVSERKMFSTLETLGPAEPWEDLTQKQFRMLLNRSFDQSMEKAAKFATLIFPD